MLFLIMKYADIDSFDNLEMISRNETSYIIDIVTSRVLIKLD